VPDEPEEPEDDDTEYGWLLVAALALLATLSDEAKRRAEGLLAIIAAELAAGRDPGQRVVSELGRLLGWTLALARKWLLDAWRKGAKDNYRKRGGARIQGYMRLAQQDDRTCAACLLLDGTIYQREDEFSDHPNGRCHLVPVLDRNAMPERETGREWLLRQDEATQRSIMGNPNYEAWQRGAIDLDDMKGVHRAPDGSESWTQVGVNKAQQNAARRRGVMP
jgi:hypothetical protein